VTVYSESGGGYYYDFATVGYSNAGAPLWTNTCSGPSANVADNRPGPGLAMDSNGNVLVTGYATDRNGLGYYITVAYSSGGIPLWTNLYKGATNSDDLAYAIAVDNSGNVFVTGTSSGTNGYNNYYDYVTIKYSSSVQPYLAIHEINQQVVLSWTNAGFDLLSAPAITGVFTNIPGATSPYTNPITGLQRFFRLAGQ
jgi:hypothetical protein